MTASTIIKDRNFKELAEVRTDSKNRIGLGRRVSPKAHLYRLYQNEAGQIILDPMIAIPAYEAWLFTNKKAEASVLKGLEDARQGHLIKRREDFSKYVED